MFIPLNVNNTDSTVSRPNILIAGDTAGIFYLLGILSRFEFNIFLADTGVKGPGPSEFRRGGGNTGQDMSNVYYDFFGSADNIGAGIIRRMDFVIATSCGDWPAIWSRCFHVPFVSVAHDTEGSLLEFEGFGFIQCQPIGSNNISDTISGLIVPNIEAPSHRYRIRAVTRVRIEKDGTAHITYDNYNGPVRLNPLIPEETGYSAWDDVGEILRHGEIMSIDVFNMKTIMAEGDEHNRLKMIEAGVPELHVIKLESPKKTRYVELTGDLVRVFDGIF
ncbi:hypothetical protein CUJ83_14835 [Methanocella sp. CWC-04]|uniref:Uncharacterized protein n=1 Tax=Methanooceanicella nereidis TaxID=2052831 RepID=A0AAP2W8R1_9EURY|nr:hypothetical protein [Methanocella sp. CWC-04]MCD1296276.1 hypothetical protein [Methanocella sp. CWC-04]